jgi:hypothetical protein
VKDVEDKARSTAEKIVGDTQSGYENLQARLHDINKELFGQKRSIKGYSSSPTLTKAATTAAKEAARYGSAEQQLGEDAQRGEQILREQQTLQVPSFTQSLYPEERPKNPLKVSEQSSNPSIAERVKDSRSDRLEKVSELSSSRGPMDRFANASILLVNIKTSCS